VPDTTSHNFTWTLDTIGIQGQLNDVAIINDTDVWAVGQIYLYDSAAGHEDPTIYNAAHWDGRSWKPIRIWWDSASNSVEQLTAIYAFNDNDIWVSYSGLYHWDGKNWHTYTGNGVFNNALQRIWGTSSQDLYIAERSGNIVHWNGGGFTSISSGTTLPIVDIYGDTNHTTGKEEILCAVSSTPDKLPATQLLHLTGATVTQVYDTGLSNHHVSALWFKSGERYAVTGDGIFIKNSLDTMAWKYFPPGVVTSYYTESVCGQDTNDIITAGDYGEVTHYNGSTWKKYTEIPALYPNVIFDLARVQMKGNSVFAVGSTASSFSLPIILRGKR
jgi:hypothetical protein